MGKNPCVDVAVEMTCHVRRVHVRSAFSAHVMLQGKGVTLVCCTWSVTRFEPNTPDHCYLCFCTFNTQYLKQMRWENQIFLWAHPRSERMGEDNFHESQNHMVQKNRLSSSSSSSSTSLSSFVWLFSLPHHCGTMLLHNGGEITFALPMTHMDKNVNGFMVLWCLFLALLFYLYILNWNEYDESAGCSMFLTCNCLNVSDAICNAIRGTKTHKVTINIQLHSWIQMEIAKSCSVDIFLHQK